MNRTMSGPEVKLAMRVIGLRGTRFSATRNQWDCVRHVDVPLRRSLEEKGHLALARTREGLLRWSLTLQGINQLKLQIGEFSMAKVG